MWGIEGLLPEAFLLAVGFFAPRRDVGSVALLLYAVATATQIERSYFFSAFPAEVWLLISLFAGATLLAWHWHALPGEGIRVIFWIVATYGLLIRSRHLAWSWGLLESAALGGYFFVAIVGKEKEKWRAALRYFIWSVLGSALILLGIALRLAEGHSLIYPLASGSTLSWAFLSWGWAIKVAFLPWHGWMMGLYRTLPLAWGAWFSVVPKGALLLNFIYLLPEEGGASLFLWYVFGVFSLLGGYAAAWAASTPTEMLFWGTFAQAGYMVLASVYGGEESAAAFWLVYGWASLLSFLYVDRPWRGRLGDSVGLLLLSNLAALPPVLGFWVKVGLFWVGLRHLPPGVREMVVGAAALATLAGFAVYGKLLWRIWDQPGEPVPFWRRVVYGVGTVGLLGLGFWGLAGLQSLKRFL